MARTSKGFLAVAAKLQEAAAALTHSDLRAQLASALNDCYAGGGCCSYLIDVIGDDQSGFVYFSSNGDILQAAYTMANTDGKRSCAIDVEGAIEVLPRTIYEPEADSELSATEAARQFVASCQRIAKGKPWEKHLAEAWQPSVQPLRPSAAGSISLVESAAFLDELKLAEADTKTDYLVKLIAPGKGSSAFYPAEVLKRDGPKVFKAGMHMYWNHQTEAEESARPEGDLSHLAGVLTGNAFYDESGTKGAGLYAKAKVFQDYAKQVEDKGPHIGVSIRAMGEAEAGVMKEGKPVLTKFTAGQSTDFVTHAGAGGLILTESAEAGENNMDAVQLKEFNEAKAKLAITEAALLKVNQRLALGEAARAADRYFGTLQGIAPGIVKRVTERVLMGTVPLTDAGELDAKKFEEALAAETKSETAYISSLTGGARIQGLGAAPVAQTPEQLAEADKNFEKEYSETMAKLAGVMVGSGEPEKKMRESFTQGRAA